MTTEREAKTIVIVAAVIVVGWMAYLLYASITPAHGASLYGTFTDPAGYYVAPTVKKVMKNGAAWTAANVAYFNTSTVAGPNVPGQVGFRLDNATSTATYELQNKNSAGTYRGYSWEYVLPADYKADVSALATQSRLNSGFSNSSSALDSIQAKTTNLPSDPADASVIAAKFANVSTHGDRDWTGSQAVDEDAIADGLWDRAYANYTSDGTFGEKVNHMPDIWPW